MSMYDYNDDYIERVKKVTRYKSIPEEAWEVALKNGWYVDWVPLYTRGGRTWNNPDFGPESERGKYFCNDIMEKLIPEFVYESDYMPGLDFAGCKDYDEKLQRYNEEYYVDSVNHLFMFKVEPYHKNQFTYTVNVLCVKKQVRSDAWACTYYCSGVFDRPYMKEEIYQERKLIK